MKQLLTGLIVLLSSTQISADAERGKTLHDEHCMKCHDTSVYSRSDRFVTDMTALEKQIRRCEQHAGARWFDADITDVAEYLNQTFYSFK